MAIGGPGTLIAGGRLLPPTDKPSEERQLRLRAEEAKLRDELGALQDRKRRGMYAWERSRCEAEFANFRVEVAERQLIAAGDVTTVAGGPASSSSLAASSSLLE